MKSTPPELEPPGFASPLPAAARHPFPRFQLLDVKISGATLPEVVTVLLGWAGRRERRSVCVFAVDSLLQCRGNASLAQIANAADMTLADGMPLVWIGRCLAHLPVRRCYGPDLMLETLAAGCVCGVRHYFYGGADAGVLERLETRLRERFPTLQVAGRFSPPHRPLTPAERDAVVRDIQASRADIVWVGIGTPKQDYWVGEFRPLLDVPVLIAVGAAFNFHAGVVRQAPRWMMRFGLEWLFRLVMEPRRLWRRYLLGNPRFLLLLLHQWLTGRPVRLGQTFPPDP